MSASTIELTLEIGVWIIISMTLVSILSLGFLVTTAALPRGTRFREAVARRLTEARGSLRFEEISGESPNQETTHLTISLPAPPDILDDLLYSEIVDAAAPPLPWEEAQAMERGESEPQGATLKKFSLQEVNLQGVDRSGMSFIGGNLQGANLQEANLQEADLRGADLRGSNLQKTILAEANLAGANFKGADLRGANLKGSDLRWTNLGGANLQEADLRGANLHEAKQLTQEQLEQANGDENTKLPEDLTKPVAWFGSAGDRTYAS